MGITCFTAPTQCFQILHMCTFQRCCARFKKVVHISEMLCTFQRCCAHVRDVVRVSQKLRTFHKSCARFTSPQIMFVFNCIRATKHVLPIYLCKIL